jgi:hypothetical protein
LIHIESGTSKSTRTRAHGDRKMEWRQLHTGVLLRKAAARFVVLNTTVYIKMTKL